MRLTLTLAVIIVCFGISLAVEAPSHNKKHHNKKHLKKHGANAKREMINEEWEDYNGISQPDDVNPDVDAPESSCKCYCDDINDPQQAKRHKKHKKHVAKRDAVESILDPSDPNTDCSEECHLKCESPEPSAEQEGVEDAQKKKKHSGLKRHNKHH
nr:uncharacterized protein LOC111424262 [Onthophagus taurus]